MITKYQWRGENVSEEEFLKLSSSKLVDANLIRVSTIDGESVIVRTERVPSYFIENQRYGPGACSKYGMFFEYYEEIDRGE